MAPPSRSTSPARFQSPEVRRRQILDAAARLAVDDGLENTSIAKVAEAAGLAKGSIYLHFGSRTALLAGLQADVWQRMLERPNDLLADQALDWAMKLDGVVAHWMGFEFEHHGLYHAVFHTVATDREEPLVAARSLLDDLIRRGTAAGEFDLDGLDVEVVVDFLIHGYVGPCFHQADRGPAVHTVQRLFRRAVGADHQPGPDL